MCRPLSCCRCSASSFTVFFTSNIMPHVLLAHIFYRPPTLAYIFYSTRQPPIALFCLLYRQILNLYLRNQAYY